MDQKKSILKNLCLLVCVLVKNVVMNLEFNHIISIWKPTKNESFEGYFYVFPTILIEKQNTDIIPAWTQIHFCWLCFDFWLKFNLCHYK